VRPPWLTLPARDPAPLDEIARVLEKHRLHSVCESADCPNVGECSSRGTCTFMILGNICTRNCRFCAVATGRPLAPDPDEPRRIARAVSALGMRHVVVTSVTRDDLADGGAHQFVRTLEELRSSTAATVELLVPDFHGNKDALDMVLAVGPDVLAHNIETVPRLYSQVRARASYRRSLDLLAAAAQHSRLAKSGLMLGLGETLHEVFEVLRDLRDAGCDVVTLGQYLQPTEQNWPIARFTSPDAFAAIERKARAMGFLACVAGPLVRSSYKAEATLACAAGTSG
jgi:lipoyl synthase